MAADADRLAREEDAAWIDLHATFDAIDGERFEAPGVTPDGWSPKDAMFHVAAWCAEAARQLERMRLGTYVDPSIEADAQNRAWFELSQRARRADREGRAPRRADEDAPGVVRARRAR